MNDVETRGQPGRQRPSSELLKNLGLHSWYSTNPDHRAYFDIPEGLTFLGHPKSAWSDPEFWARQIHADDREQALSQLRAAAGTPGIHTVEYRLVGMDETYLWLRDVVEVVPHSGLRGITQDMTTERLAVIQSQLLVSLADSFKEGGDIRSAFGTILERICRLTGWVIGQAWIPDLSGVYRCIASWHEDDEGLRVFANQSRQTSIPLFQGLVGTVFREQSPVWIRNVTTDLRFSRGPVAAQAGLKAGVGIPVFSGRNVIAILEFYMRKERGRDKQFLELIATSGTYLGSIVRLELTESRRSTISRLLTSILRHSPNMIFVKDREGRYIEVNEVFLRTFHMTREQVIGKTDLEIFPLEQAEAFRANDRKVLASGRALEFEETALHDDGPHVSIVHKFPLRDEHGIYALAGIVTDITHRHRKEGRDSD